MSSDFQTKTIAPSEHLKPVAAYYIGERNGIAQFILNILGIKLPRLGHKTIGFSRSIDYASLSLPDRLTILDDGLEGTDIYNQDIPEFDAWMEQTIQTKDPNVVKDTLTYITLSIASYFPWLDTRKREPLEKGRERLLEELTRLYENKEVDIITPEYLFYRGSTLHAMKHSDLTMPAVLIILSGYLPPKGEKHEENEPEFYDWIEEIIQTDDPEIIRDTATYLRLRKSFFSYEDEENPESTLADEYQLTHFDKGLKILEEKLATYE